jgi:hypothetical protein
MPRPGSAPPGEVDEARAVSGEDAHFMNCENLQNGRPIEKQKKVRILRFENVQKSRR